MKRMLILLLCAALLLCGCSGQNGTQNPTTPTYFGDTNGVKPNGTQQEDQTLSLVYAPEESLNPYQSQNTANRALFSLIYQGLFSVDRKYEAYPILCDTYNVSADLMTYTFYLAAALFSDGTQLTANDVVASLKAAQESPWYGGRLQHVKSISAYGGAVVVELSTPMENLPLLLDIPVVKASQVSAQKPVGSGPYRLEGATLRRQAAWWCDAQLPVYGDTIALTEGGSPAQIRDAFEFEGISLVVADPSSDRYVDFRGDYEMWDIETGKLLYLVCNEKSAIFSNAAIRQALTHAIDRERLSQRFYHGLARAASLPASPASAWYTASLAQRYSYAPELFAEAVTGAALTENTVTLLLNGDDVIRLRVGLAIADMLRAGGLKVNVVKSSAEDLEKNLKNSEYDLYLGQTKLSANMDISAFFGTDTALNYGGLADAALYEMSLAAISNAGNFYKLHEAVMEEGQLCPVLFLSDGVYVRRGTLPELSPARDGVFFYDLGRTLENAMVSN